MLSAHFKHPPVSDAISKLRAASEPVLAVAA
jgi:hypothetical protein